MALKITTLGSKIIGDKHEREGNSKNHQPKYEENMDKWNNNEGRKIAEEIKQEYTLHERIILINNGKMDDIIAEKVIQKMRTGKLITNPFTDKRKFDEKSFKDRIFNLKNRVFYKNELTMNDLDNPIIKDTFWDQVFDNNTFPAKEELDERVHSGELVYVDDYTRGDGTHVSGYYRSYPRS